MPVVRNALAKRRASVEVPKPQAIIASAARIPLDGTSWKTWRLGDNKWQQDAWDFYDTNGELRFIANWAGQACSRARLFIADLDELGRPGEETKDVDIQLLSETVFGGPANKAEAQRLMGLHLYIPGESFIVAEGVDNSETDRWYVVSTSGIRRRGMTQIEVERPQDYGGGWYMLTEGTDLLIRVWTPHPRKPDLADSSVRAGLIPLREIAQLTKYEFAQIDSRLAGAGMLFLPEEMDFPRGDEDDNSSAGLTGVLTKAMSAALADRADPASLVPIVVQVAGEYIGKMQHLTFGGELNDKVAEMKEAAMSRLARALDVDPEILTGKGDTNHWSAWQIEESTIKMHIEPLLARMCDALTTGYLRAALELMGKDPDKYTFWYDISPLTVQPDRQGDALELWREGLISAEELRTVSNFSEDAEPSDEEKEHKLAMELVKLDPALIHEDAIQKALGISWKLTKPAELLPPDQLNPADQPDKPGAGGAPGQPGGGNVRQMPQGRAQQAPARGNPTRQAAVLQTGAGFLVLRALELAGKKLLTRGTRDKHHDVMAWDLHTRIRVLGRDHAMALVPETFHTLDRLAEDAEVDPALLNDLLRAYVTELVWRGVPHTPELLEVTLAHGLHAGCDAVCHHPAHPGPCRASLRASALAIEALDDWDEYDEEDLEYHLRGRHDQKNHGRRRSNPSFQPFSPAERANRRSMRAGRVDPDKDASAPDRQGRAGMRDATAKAKRLTTEEVDRTHGKALVKEDARREAARVERERAARLERDRAIRAARPGRATSALTPEATDEAEVRINDRLAQMNRDLATLDQRRAGPYGTVRRGNRQVRTPAQIERDRIIGQASRDIQAEGRPMLRQIAGERGLDDGGANSSRQWLAMKLIQDRLEPPGSRNQVEQDNADDFHQVERGVADVHDQLEAGVMTPAEAMRTLVQYPRRHLVQVAEDNGAGPISDRLATTAVVRDMVNDMMAGINGTQDRRAAREARAPGFTNSVFHTDAGPDERAQRADDYFANRYGDPAQSVQPGRPATTPPRPTRASLRDAFANPPQQEARPLPPDLDRMGQDIQHQPGTPEYAEANARVRAAVSAAWDFKDPGSGFTSRVSDVRIGLNSVSAEIEISDANGRQVGSSQRVITTKRRYVEGQGFTGDVDLEVDHAFLLIGNRNARGGGFSKAYNANAFAVYKEMGVKRVTIHADIDVGGYAWAKQGFQFQNNRQAANIASRFQRLLMDWDAEEAGRGSYINWENYGGRPSAHTMLQLRNMITRVKDQNQNNPEGPAAVSPLEFAQLGHRPGTTGKDAKWLGKNVMLGSDWYGFRPIGDDAMRADASADQLAAVRRWWEVWTDQVAPWIPADPKAATKDPSDYNEHHHDISADPYADDLFWLGVQAILDGGEPLA